MAKEYRPSHLFNRFTMFLSRLGVGPSQTLTTTGRFTGEAREVPVTPLVLDGVEYLVAPYGDVSWVRNARANPAVTLRTGRTVRRCELVDVTDRSAHVVEAYWRKERFPRPFMDIPPEPTREDFEAATGLFPVFRVEEAR